MRARFVIQSPGLSPARVAASPLSTRCIFGVLTSRFPMFRCLRCQAANQEQSFQHRDVFSYRAPVETEFPGKAGGVQQLAVSCRQQLQQARDAVGIPDPADIEDISVHDAPDVLPVPLAGADRVAAQGAPDTRRIPGACPGRRDPAPAFPACNSGVMSPRRRSGQETAGTAFLFGLGQGHEARDFHAPRQRFGDSGKQEKVRGAGEDEASGSPVLIDGQLDDWKQLRRALDFVNGDFPGKRRDEAGGIPLGGGEVRRMIQAEVRAFRHHRPHQRGLAASGAGR